VVPSTRVPTALLWSTLALAVAAIVLAALSFTRETPVPTPSSTSPKAVVTMPDLVGQSLPQAEAESQSLGLQVTVQAGTGCAQANLQPNLVCSQSPVGGQRVHRGSNVTFVVGIG
jgi:hypothetical protein